MNEAHNSPQQQEQTVERAYPSRINSKRSTLKHILIKLPKTKDQERIMKAARDK